MASAVKSWQTRASSCSAYPRIGGDREAELPLRVVRLHEPRLSPACAALARVGCVFSFSYERLNVLSTRIRSDPIGLYIDAALAAGHRLAIL